MVKTIQIIHIKPQGIIKNHDRLIRISAIVTGPEHTQQTDPAIIIHIMYVSAEC